MGVLSSFAEAFCGYGFVVEPEVHCRLVSLVAQWSSPTFVPPGRYVPSLVEACIECLLVNPEALKAEELDRVELAPFREILTTGDYALLEKVGTEGIEGPVEKKMKTAGEVRGSVWVCACLSVRRRQSTAVRPPLRGCGYP